eukprot:CAMPEP_0117016316 /NCGR_PEP_ID=MMETSP0472-20121206/12880_1 /TAXON_ID=693140 ORGANISM="Tiarina fusus, Strain LIS" /NCGR_SAMPLE_ID=MMETSP0472 /ASSEMBLY_ACC=CAM_ASM_000603 /LENGTH=272 /DNA_ID=CAMNT_0004720331 /DNA_START=1 /DNA_END=816 /DNA_ORIENTATION=-
MADAGPKAQAIKAKRRLTRIGPLYDFKQQECWSCIAIMRPIPMALCLIILGIICLAFGIIWGVSASFAKESLAYRYDNLCDLNHKCTFRFKLEEDLEAPVYLYYRLEGYYQAYRRYYSSRSFPQLRGENVNDYDELGGCTSKIAEDDEMDDPSAVFLPCGLIATSYFNDTYTLLKDNGEKVDQSSKDINIPSDSRLYNDPGPGTDGIRVVDSFENPLLMVWMRAAALPNFLKLYAIIDEDLDAGMYKMEINNHYPVEDYKARKFFKLSTTTW